MSTTHATVAAVIAAASLALVLRKRAQARAPVQCVPGKDDNSPEAPVQCVPGKDDNSPEAPVQCVPCKDDNSPEVLTFPRKASNGRPVASDPRQDPRHHLNRRFFADTDKAGLVRCDLRLVDRFLSLECGHELLRMGLFPNAQEISESMACLQAAIEHLHAVVSLSDTDVVALVVGDGRTPRTAALLAMRTRWTVLSVDPALAGLLPAAEAEAPAQVQAEPAAQVEAAAEAEAEAPSGERCRKPTLTLTTDPNPHPDH